MRSPRSRTPLRITPFQVAMVYLYRDTLRLTEAEFRDCLHAVTGVGTPEELDPQRLGKLVDLICGSLYSVRRHGRRTFGERPRMATGREVQMVQSLWC